MEPSPPLPASGWARRVHEWWPPVAAFLAVLIGVPVLVLLAAYAIAGDDDLYAIGPTRSCLEDAEGVTVSDEVDDVLAKSATGGALEARLPANRLVLSFGESVEEAERRQRSYFRVATATIPVQELLQRQQNAVLLWESRPSERDSELVDDCLS